MVDLLRRCKDAGHTIIIYTARGMWTSKGNMGQATAAHAHETLDWLSDNDIPYDEIYFGKPGADIYIDDMAYNARQTPIRELENTISFLAIRAKK